MFKVAQTFRKSKAKPTFVNFGAMLDKASLSGCNSEMSPIRIYQRLQYDDKQLQLKQDVPGVRGRHGPLALDPNQPGVQGVKGVLSMLVET